MEGQSLVDVLIERFPERSSLKMMEEACELTVRREEPGMLRAFVDITNVGDSGWEPPLVDETGHLQRHRGIEMGEFVLQPMWSCTKRPT